MFLQFPEPVLGRTRCTRKDSVRVTEFFGIGMSATFPAARRGFWAAKMLDCESTSGTRSRVRLQQRNGRSGRAAGAERPYFQSLARERADLGRSGRSFLGAAALRSARDLRDSVPLGGLATLADS